jgi:hypothetical protein
VGCEGDMFPGEEVVCRWLGNYQCSEEKDHLAWLCEGSQNQKW